MEEQLAKAVMREAASAVEAGVKADWVGEEEVAVVMAEVGMVGMAGEAKAEVVGVDAAHQLVREGAIRAVAEMAGVAEEEVP